VVEAAEDAESRALPGPRNALALPELYAMTTIVLGFDFHVRDCPVRGLLGARLSGLFLQHFAGVAHALLLVRVRLAHPQ
jgi:hypothetical protein